MTLTVLVPTSLVREAEDKREATRKLGYVARAATVFRADDLVVFPDREGERRWGGGFVETVLRYAATPPYLRKEVWGKRDELEYVGVLPPLLASSQTGSESSGSLQQGIVTEVGPEGRVRVNCGMQHPVSLVVPPSMEVDAGERVAIRISSREPVRARIVDEPLPGLDVSRVDLEEALTRPNAGVRIATSRHGAELTVTRLTALHDAVAAAGGDVTVAFGAPGRGLPDILGVDAEDVSAGADDSGLLRSASGDGGTGGSSVEPNGPGFDLWLNTIPRQGSEVVRTEEAMFASLSPLTLTE